MFPDKWDFCEYVTLQPIIVSSNLITVIINLSAHITSFKKVAHLLSFNCIRACYENCSWGIIFLIKMLLRCV